MSGCPECGVVMDGNLANELAATARQLEHQAENAAFAKADVRVRDVKYLVALLRRGARATCSSNKEQRKMVSGDLWDRSEHRFPEDCWAGGRTDCRRCGAYLNSFYDDEHGCRGPTWMRAFDGWDGGREE